MQSVIYVILIVAMTLELLWLLMSFISDWFVSERSPSLKSKLLTAQSLVVLVICTVGFVNK